MSNADTRVPHVFGTSYKRGSVVPPATGSTELVVFQDTDGQMKTVNAAGTKGALGGGVTLQWRQQMYAYAKTQLGTLESDFMIDFDRGSTGDYGTNNAAGTGVANLNTNFNGGVLTLDTGANANSTIGVSPIGTPTILTSTKNGPPWFNATRAKPFGTIDAQGTFDICAVTTAGTPGTALCSLGIRGTNSTAFLTLSIRAGGTTVLVTVQAIDTTQFVDYGLGFDGTTLTAYYGQLMAGTFAPIAAGFITDLTNMNASTGAPWAFMNGGTLASSRGFSIDNQFMAYKRS